MELLAFILAIMALDIPEQQVAAAISEYIEEHPEAIAEVSVASVSDTKGYLGYT